MVLGRDSVVPNLAAALKNRNHKLDELFDVKILPMKKKPKTSDTSKTKTQVDNSTLDEDGYITVARLGVIQPIFKLVNIYKLLFRFSAMIVTILFKKF